MFLRQALRQIGRGFAPGGAFLLFFLFLPALSFASVGNLTLAWDSNTETDIAGYRLHYGTQSGSYNNHAEVGLNTRYTLEGLVQGTYYLVITAYNRSGNESSYSNEVRYSVAASQVPPQKPDPTIPADPIIPPANPATPILVPATGTATYSTPGISNAFHMGYATVTAKDGVAPKAVAFISYSEGGEWVSTAGMTASIPTKSARVIADHRKQFASGNGKLDVRTGFSVVNPGRDAASLHFTLRNQSGDILQIKESGLAAGEHIAKFLDDLFDDIPDTFGLGSLEIQSDLPISVMALRLTINQSGKLLLSTMPTADAPTEERNGPVYFPLMNTGGGFQTSVLLLNSSSQVQSGKILLLTQKGTILNTGNMSSTPTMATYRIQPGGVFQMKTSSSGTVEKGWMKVVPDQGTDTPEAAEVLGYSTGGALVSETIFPAMKPAHQVSMYVDESKGHRANVAVSNPGTRPLRIELKSSQKGAPALTMDVPASGAVNTQIREIFRGAIPADFKGTVEIQSVEPFVAGGLDTYANEQGNLVFSNSPVLESGTSAVSNAMFPQVADGEGYQTNFVFINSSQNPSSVELTLSD